MNSTSGWIGLWIALAFCAGATACEADERDPADTQRQGTTDSDTVATRPAPAAPVDDSQAAKVASFRRWYLIGNAATAGQDTLALRLRDLAEMRYVEAWAGEAYLGKFEVSGGVALVNPSIAALLPGTYDLLIAADGSETAFLRLKLERTHPLYVLVTNDWDSPDNPDPTLRRQEQLHANHPALRLTHFVGPYVFTESSVTPARAKALRDWVVGMQDTYSDEIGLHIHPYCSFVEAAGLTCRTTPSFVQATPDATGYTVYLSSYPENETARLLTSAKAIFAEQGLGVPTSFRAGGWIALLHTLNALFDAGFVADTSANNWKRLEEWKGVTRGTLYTWNEEHWSSIGDTSQPYYPSADDILVAGTPGSAILEVPDNGSLVDYVAVQEMIDIFKQNWSGGALDHPKTYVIGYHPPNFDVFFFNTIDHALDHVDGFLNADDTGPVVYSTLSPMAEVFGAKD